MRACVFAYPHACDCIVHKHSLFSFPTSIRRYKPIRRLTGLFVCFCVCVCVCVVVCVCLCVCVCGVVVVCVYCVCCSMLLLCDRAHKCVSSCVSNIMFAGSPAPCGVCVEADHLCVYLR